MTRGPGIGLALCLAGVLAAQDAEEAAWRALDSGSQALLLGIATLDDGTCIAVGGGAEEDPAVVLRSADGGASWKPCALDVRARLYAVHFPTKDVGYAVGFRGVVLKSTDGGRSWSRSASGTEAWLSSVFFLDAEHGFVAGSDLVLETRDGGETWTPVNLPELPPRPSIRDLVFVTNEIGFLVGDQGLLCKTTDGGAKWRVVRTGTDTWLRAISFADEKNGYVAGAAGVVLATRDGGESWSSLPHPGQKLNDVLFLDARVGLTTTMEGDLYRTTDGGRTWAVVQRSESGALVGIGASSKGTFVVGDGGVVLLREPSTGPIR